MSKKRILFLTLVKINTLKERGIYHDLLNEFKEHGHILNIVCPNERRNGRDTQLINEEGVKILKVKTLNITKSNIIEKGLGTLMLENQYLKAIKEFFFNDKFDLVLYSTPPITFYNVIKYIKNRDNAYTYLLLKDIFPQNAVDMRMIKENGIIHRYFRKKEEKLYDISDTIGCMSVANKDYILKHNQQIKQGKVEVNPNSIKPILNYVEDNLNKEIRIKYDLPVDKKIFVYGGNLGKPQGIDFLLETIKYNNNNKDVYFLIVGDGTEYNNVINWYTESKPPNVQIFKQLNKEDYDKLVSSCDVGLIFLDKNFTIPNFPSRLLSYLECGLPVIAATDVVSDIGKVIEENQCGYWVNSGDLFKMQESIDLMINEVDIFNQMKLNSKKLLEKEFEVSKSYQLIIDKIMK